MIEFRDAKREELRLLILLAGGTGSGKTESAMRLATGLARRQKFAVIDTENGRALHKADDYSFKHYGLDEPFSPERYIEAVQAADAAGFPVVVIDSGSHEYDGPGGVLDIQAEEFERMGKRDAARMSSWIEPKRRHKRFVQTLLRSQAHVILCLRAEDKIEIVKDAEGKTVVRPKETLTGTQGWVPIVEKRLPFEATISLLLLQDNPGVPVPIKLERRHAELVPLDQPLSEDTGARLAEWAAGAAPKDPGASTPRTDGVATPTLQDTLEEHVAALNALVGQLREAGTISTRQLYAKVAGMRGIKGDERSGMKPSDVLVALLSGADADGELHWSPLRDSLKLDEAAELRKRLGKLWAEQKEGAAA